MGQITILMSTSAILNSGNFVIKALQAHKLACCLRVCVELNLIDLLANGPLHISEIARSTNTREDLLYRFFQVLTAAGLLRESSGRVFVSTELAASLSPGQPGSMHAFITFIMKDQYDAFANILHTLRTGEPAFDLVHQLPMWVYFSEHPEKAATFNKAMTGISEFQVNAILEGYDFSPYTKILDIAGGNGALLTAILQRNTDAGGVVLDQESLLPKTMENIYLQGLKERCHAIGGDFFDNIPAGFELYMLKYILHDWSDVMHYVFLKTATRRCLHLPGS
ncbi:hypothetical protein F3J22_23325 [Chitinophaga sp. Cy-1792]|nr:methyltransferase [Chitinophaga sp. Cy-1792]NIG56431.1 hypothetical protein [Chitinophaga sp. Cy-1792]